ncbi:hypothetical protein H6503_03800 [Candidatus Woesearchaeota archaeon]|nr:hypothetical protein [Candidatus Woesearchaeota archaeon]
MRMPKKWWTLYKDEIKSIEHVISFSLVFISLLISMYIFFTSKVLQLIALMMLETVSHTSYYHIMGFYVLMIAMPFICLILFYDAVYRDLEDERVRLLVTKMRRIEYLAAKYLARLTVVAAVLIAIVIFISIYSGVKIGNLYLEVSLATFLIYLMLSICLGSIYLLISCFSEHPLFVSLLVPIISFVLTGIGFENYSFYSYLEFGPITWKIFGYFASLTIISMMATVYLFRRKRL